MAIEQFNHIKDVLDELDSQRPARFGYTDAAVNATGAAEITALEGLFIIEDPTQINSIPTPDLIGVDPVIVNIGLRTQAATISRMALNHFFGRLGLNLLKVTEKLKMLVNEHLVNRYITPSGKVVEQITVSHETDQIRLIQHQSPLSASAPVTASAPITLLPAVYDGAAGIMTGADKKALDDMPNAVVNLTADQTVAGVKTFSSIPVLPASNPTSDNQAARKAYIDGLVGNLQPSNVNITGDTTLSPGTNNYISASAIVTLTLPETANKGQTIKIIDLTGYGFKLKRYDYTTQYLKSLKYSFDISNKFGEYLKTATSRVYSAWELICTENNTKWQEILDIDLIAVKGYGYIAGGNIIDDAAYYSTIEKLNLVDTSKSVLSATLNTTKPYLGSSGVSARDYGYIAGGSYKTSEYAYACYNTIDNISFANDTSEQISSVLPTAKRLCSGTQSSTYGYFIGGDVGPVMMAAITDISKINLTTTATSTSTEALDTAGYGLGIVENALAAYTGNFSNTYCQKLLFSTEVTSILSAVWTYLHSGAAGISSKDKGYVSLSTYDGNFNPLYSFQALTFLSETITTISAGLASNAMSRASVNGNTDGFFAGGIDSNVIVKFNFATESSAIISATLTVAKYNACGVSGIY